MNRDKKHLCFLAITDLGYWLWQPLAKADWNLSKFRLVTHPKAVLKTSVMNKPFLLYVVVMCHYCYMSLLLL